MESWQSFFSVQAAVAATLAGLVFVGISINISKIVASPELPGRALESVVALIMILIVSTLIIAPDQSDRLTGTSIVIAGLTAWLIIVWIHVRDWRFLRQSAVRNSPRWSLPVRVVLGQLATVPILIAGVSLIRGEPDGLTWILTATIATYVFAFSDAWVLLVEIDR